MSKGIYLSLGSNMGDRYQNLAKAYEHIKGQIGEIIEKSKVYETEPWGEDAGAENYLNQVIRIKTTHQPDALLKSIKLIEQMMGRPSKGSNPNEPRVIDIDILFYHEQKVNTPTLILPHPRLHERNFVLIPMAELDDEFEHPVFNKTVGDLYIECHDPTEVYLPDDEE